MRITLEGEVLALHFRYDPVMVGKAQGVPNRRFNRTAKVWECKPTWDAMHYIKMVFPEAEWDDKSEEVYQTVLSTRQARDRVADGEIPQNDDLSDVPFRLPPFQHQKTALLLGRDQPAFAYLMEMGTGKTKVLLDDAAHNFRRGRIDALLVLCPNSVKTNWVSVGETGDQVGTHLAPDIDSVRCAWFASPTSLQKDNMDLLDYNLTDRSKLLILVANVESLHVPRLYDYLSEFCQKRKVMIAVDESTRIKNRAAKRTKAAFKLRKLCKLARIMSGTPLVKSPLDAFAQFWFLDPNILGFGSYMTFQSHFSIMGGWRNKQAVAFKNLDELTRLIAGVSYRVTKDQCLDLPEKLYDKRRIHMTDEQKRHYHRLREDGITWLNSHHVVLASDILSVMLRLQQVTSGFLPLIDQTSNEVIDVIPICEPTPKIEEALNIIEETSGKVIIWCRFLKEIDMMSRELDKAGIKHVVFHGGVNEQDRVNARHSFQNVPETRVFIGQIRTGGIGLDLYAASTVIYLSNSFSTEDRLQSEDRAHRIGQTKNVQYVDLVCPGTIDGKIIGVLRDNKKLSDEIMRDGYRDWI